MGGESRGGYCKCNCKGGRQTDRHHLTNNSVGRVADAELAVCDSMV